MGNNTSQPEDKASGSDVPRHPHRRPSLKISASPNQPRPQASRLPVLPHHRQAGQAGSVSPLAPLSPGPGVGHPPNSPRRRRSLELPDLNRLTLTPTATPHLSTDVSTKVVLPSGERGGGGLSPLGVTIEGIPGLGGDVDDATVPTTSPPASGTKRMSLMSGTRAKSPHSGSRRSSRDDSLEGMPIPGASPTKRRKSPTRGQIGDNPYFPAVEERRVGRREKPAGTGTSTIPPPATPGLPNYSHSPAGVSSLSSDAEETSPSKPTDPGRDRLSAPPTTTNNSGRHPSPSKPAPAIVTREITPTSPRSDTVRSQANPSAGGPSEYVQVGQQAQLKPHDVILSSLPEGSSPLKSKTGLPGEERRESDGSAAATPTPQTATTFARQQATPSVTAPLPSTGAAERKGQTSRAPTDEPAAIKTKEEEDGLVPTLVTWTGGGKDVYVTGTFADGGWKNRIKMERSTHDFSLMLNLPPGTHRLKFIVDDHWRCSNDLQTATDGDGNLVNWLEVESETTRRGADEDWAIQEWAKKITSVAVIDEDDPRLWTSDIPAALINFQITEERALSDPPDDLPHAQLTAYRQSQQTLLSSVPVPPTLPRHLEKVILNTTAKELEGTVGGTGGDDNSILPVPNHVVLQHLTASAIKNGTLAVGTTTRYKRKVRNVWYAC